MQMDTPEKGRSMETGQSCRTLRAHLQGNVGVRSTPRENHERHSWAPLLQLGRNPDRSSQDVQSSASAPVMATDGNETTRVGCVIRRVLLVQPFTFGGHVEFCRPRTCQSTALHYTGILGSRNMASGRLVCTIEHTTSESMIQPSATSSTSSTSTVVSVIIVPCFSLIFHGLSSLLSSPLPASTPHVC